MTSINRCSLPENALLKKYTESGAYTDCYQTQIDELVTHPSYVFAFYTTWLFKLERFILKWLASKPSSDLDARQLADGDADTFSAWQVEQRVENQLLLTDFRGRTRSWLMVIPANNGNTQTQLLFGSAVIPVQNKNTGETSLGLSFSMLLGFHRMYSVLLLYFAKSRLKP